MAIQTINIGNQVNDGLGDDLRSAFEKVNANFSDLDASLTVTASNLGSAGVAVFKEKVGSDLQFKRLLAGVGVTVTDLTNSVQISAYSTNAFTSITTNHGVVTADTTAGTDNITIQGGQGARNIIVTADEESGVIEIDSVLDLQQILQSFDFGYIITSLDHPIQLALASANIDFGTITNPGRTDLDLGGI